MAQCVCEGGRGTRADEKYALSVAQYAVLIISGQQSFFARNFHVYFMFSDLGEQPP